MTTLIVAAARRYTLVGVVSLHLCIIVANVAAMIVLMLTQPWYLWLPLNTLLLQRIFGGKCALTILENLLRERMGLPQIESFKRHYLLPANDASRTLLYGSRINQKSKTDLAFHGVSPGATTHVVKCFLIIAALLAFASGICQAQEPSAGPIIDRIEVRLDQARESLDRSTSESAAWRERFDRVDRFERRDREGKLQIGSRIGTFLDRVERIFWLVVIVFVVACIAIGVASAAYGIERISAGAQSVLKVVQSLADTLKAWRGKT